MWVRADATPFVRWRYAAAGLFLCLRHAHQAGAAHRGRHGVRLVDGRKLGAWQVEDPAPGRQLHLTVLLPIVVIWGLMVLYFAGNGGRGD